MQDISGFGAVFNLIASKTFPLGFPITRFADDSDPLDVASIKIADQAMGVNGDLIKWSKAQIIPVVISVIPGSDDDVNLSILANANRVGQGKQSANDVVTLTVVYPDGTTNSYTGGSITDFPPAKGIAASGRLKSRVFGLGFQDIVGS